MRGTSQGPDSSAGPFFSVRGHTSQNFFYASGVAVKCAASTSNTAFNGAIATNGAGVDEKMSIRQLSRRSGVPHPNISSANTGKRGLSLASAKKISEAVDGDKPVALYLQSQTKAIKSKLDAGGGKAAALQAITAVVRELEKVPREELAVEGDELTAAVEALHALLGDAMTGATTAATKSAEDRPSRDAYGRRVPEGSGTERDAFGRAVTKSEGPVNRDAFGRRM